jgi:putative flavoprotein involved in K+ transport
VSRSSSCLPPRAHVTVAIIGAGPAGIGVARVLRDLAIPGVRIFERKSIGASFKLWPVTTHFITPSFPSNAFGLTDLNAVSLTVRQPMSCGASI